MKSCFNRFCNTIMLLAIVATALLVGGCTMVADDTLGANMMPEEQVMVMRHLKFKGNNIVRIGVDGSNEEVDSGKKFLETRLYRTDSLLASNIGIGYMGMRRSDTLGVRTAGFASSMLYMNAIDKNDGFGYKPIFDTMYLVLSINNYGGDTLVPTNYRVYELKKPLADNVLKYDSSRKEDSVAYINCDLSEVYNQNEPIFEFTFPNSELGEGPSSVMIPMERTDYSWDFVRRLMLIPDNYADANSDWDGYGRSGIEVYSDDEKWVNKFYGVYIEPVATEENKRGAIYALDLSASGLMLQGRSRNPHDPSMIKDTVGMYYYFVDSDSKYNSSVNKISHDYTKGLTGNTQYLLNPENMDSAKPREERAEVSTCYVEGMGGPSTEIYITDDLLDYILGLESEALAAESYSKMGINQCQMTIYVDGADYDWNKTQNNALVLTPLLDKSFSRLGAYVNYNTLSPISDYDYIYESNYDTDIIYGGYLDRSRGCYTMNITVHMQKLFNYAKSVRQENGGYLFNESDANYVSRTIYIGAEAMSPYALTESVIQGAGATASIQLDLTYTLIK